MARVRPFAAYRYVRPERDISAVTAPPYDVISPEQRERASGRRRAQRRRPRTARGPARPGAPGTTATRPVRPRGATGVPEGVLAQDAEPAIYVLEQRFEHAGHPVRRRAFIVEVGLEPFDAGSRAPARAHAPQGARRPVRAHQGHRGEPEPGLRPVRRRVRRDRRAVRSRDEHRSDLHGRRRRRRRQHPVGDHRPRLLGRGATGSRRQADLHRRRPPSLHDGARLPRLPPRAGRRRRRLAAGSRLRLRDDGARQHGRPRAAGDADPPCGRRSGRLRRRGLLDRPGRALHHRGRGSRTSRWMHSKGSDRPVFVVKVARRGRASPRAVRDDVDLDAAISAPRSSAWKHLDVAVLQELVLEPLLDIHPDRPETLDRLSFIKDAQAALEATAEHDVVFVLRPTRMDAAPRSRRWRARRCRRRAPTSSPSCSPAWCFRSAE